MAFRIDISPDAQEHLAGLRKFDQVRIVDAIEAQLTNEPRKPSRNRKPMRSNLIATWELRISNFRVYYDVEQQTVFVRAIGVKHRDRVTIGDEEVELS